MADNTTLNAGTGGDAIRDKDRLGIKTQIVGLDLNIGGAETLMAGSMPVTGPLTDTQLRASAVPVDSELTTADLDTGVGTDTRAVTGLALAASGGAVLAGAANPVPVSDNGGSVTVDAPVGTPVFVRLSDGTTAIATLPVSLAALPSLAAGSALVGKVDVNSAPAQAADNAVGLPAVVGVVGGYDGTNVQALATNAAGNLQVGLSAAIPAGANAIGSVTVTGTPAVDTELPAAATLADAAANPTTPMVGSAGLVWNGTTWDRLKGDATNGAFVNVKTSVLPTGASTSAKQPALGTAGAASADVISVQGIASMTPLKVDPSAVTSPVSLAAMPALATGGNLIGRVNVEPETTGGLTTFHLVSAATTNATVVKASAGQLYGWFIHNSNAAQRKVAFHNAAATPTAGASILFALVIPPGAAANVFGECGIAFATGIAITTVTGLADTDAVAVALNDLTINLFYK